jgi:putative component of toxin-antitoxin plasmid stabilization module
MRDDEGEEVAPGDWISFSYGIPPIRVEAKVSRRNDDMWLTVLGKHKPREMKLKDLRRHVGNWYKISGPTYQA